MELYKTVDEVNDAIKNLKVCKLVIEYYQDAEKNNEFLKRTDGGLEGVDFDYIISRINVDLRQINDLTFKPISSLNELDSLLLKLNNEYASCTYLIDNIDDFKDWNITIIQAKLKYLTDLLSKINYYDGINNCYNLLDSVLKKSSNHGLLYLDSETGLIKELEDFRLRLCDNVSPEVSDKSSRILTNIILGGKQVYTSTTEQLIINDLKDAVKNISDKKIQTEMGIELLLLESKHRNNVVALRNIRFMPDFDVRTKPINIKSLISIIKIQSDSEALEFLANKYNWFNRKDLTIPEVMDIISRECESNEKFIGTNYKFKIENQIAICNEQIKVINFKDTTKVQEDLIIKRDNIDRAISTVSKYIDLSYNNMMMIELAKEEIDATIIKLNIYKQLIPELLKEEVQNEIADLDETIDDSIQFRKVIMENINIKKVDTELTSDEIYDGISQNQKYKIFSKYYLNKAVDIYLKAIRSFYNLYEDIDNAICNYSYDFDTKFQYASQLANDIDDFLDLLKPTFRERINHVLSSKAASKEVIKSEGSQNKQSFSIQNLNPKLRLQRKLFNLKLYRVYFAKQILDKVTNSHFGMSDLGEYARSEAQLMQDAEFMSDYLNSTHDDVAELIGVNPTRK